MQIADTSIFFNLRATITVEFGKGNKVAPRTNDSKETLRLLKLLSLNKPDGTATWHVSTVPVCKSTFQRCSLTSYLSHSPNKPRGTSTATATT